MCKFILSILLLCCIASLSTASARTHSKKAPVVARFGGECLGLPFRPSPRLEQLIEHSKQRTLSPGAWPCCANAFAYDLNGDGRDEYFVRLSCGGTGNCTWGIFSARPGRLRGVFTAWFFYIHRRTGLWSALTTYTREGGDQGVITTLANRRGRYIQTSERTEHGYYNNWQPFLKRMGVPKCG